jgi:hypothetical protein
MGLLYHPLMVDNMDLRWCNKWYDKAEVLGGKACPRANLFDINPKWTTPRLNPRLLFENPATNRLRHGCSDMKYTGTWIQLCRKRDVNCRQLTRATNIAECNLPREINLLSYWTTSNLLLSQGEGGGAANLVLSSGLNVAHCCSSILVSEPA